MDVAGIVLTGGASRRMGRPKADTADRGHDPGGAHRRADRGHCPTGCRGRPWPQWDAGGARHDHGRRSPRRHGHRCGLAGRTRMVGSGVGGGHRPPPPQRCPPGLAGRPPGGGVRRPPRSRRKASTPLWPLPPRGADHGRDAGGGGPKGPARPARRRPVDHLRRGRRVGPGGGRPRRASRHRHACRPGRRRTDPTLRTRGDLRPPGRHPCPGSRVSRRPPPRRPRECGHRGATRDPGRRTRPGGDPGRGDHADARP